ncbi:dual specificity protein phosphatase MPK-4-like [Choristoneura fumiferana]|uniref:dual specificity protein phosphatase MPK-4-like n=1 Tax=Choristoneura fumiferana TaxID=7141 RepID=UPI003D15CC57
MDKRTQWSARNIELHSSNTGIRPPPSKLTGLHCAENGQILIEKLKSLACQIIDGGESPGQSQSDTGTEEGPIQLDGYSEQNLVDGSIAARGAAACRLMWFVEPMAWMRRVALDPHGKLHCPKCNHKIGSFSWVCGCKCPCGQKVAPAFYLVPSKVEWSNIVQNVQVTV